MSKTVDDLKQVYLDAWCAAEGDAISAGIAAVVRALRDEFADAALRAAADFEQYGSVAPWETADAVINEILGDAGYEKVAGQDTAKPEAIERSTPATDPAPYVLTRCPACHKRIKFTEAKT